MTIASCKEIEDTLLPFKWFLEKQVTKWLLFVFLLRSPFSHRLVQDDWKLRGSCCRLVGDSQLKSSREREKSFSSLSLSSVIGLRSLFPYQPIKEEKFLVEFFVFLSTSPLSHSCFYSFDHPSIHPSLPKKRVASRNEKRERDADESFLSLLLPVGICNDVQSSSFVVRLPTWSPTTGAGEDWLLTSRSPGHIYRHLHHFTSSSLSLSLNTPFTSLASSLFSWSFCLSFSESVSHRALPPRAVVAACSYCYTHLLYQDILTPNTSYLVLDFFSLSTQ